MLDPELEYLEQRGGVCDPLDTDAPDAEPHDLSQIEFEALLCRAWSCYLSHGGRFIQERR